MPPRTPSSPRRSTATSPPSRTRSRWTSARRPSIRTSTYTIQATIVDGEHAWITGHGVPVLTKGNPKNVDITLTYRPDLLKGAVTGQITGVGIELSPTSYAMAILIDPTSGETLGIDAQNVVDGLPVAFSVPYAITDIQPTQDYVVTAEVGDDGQTWRNAAGVPVITNGNPKTAIQVVVTPVVVASPSPSPSPSPTPSPACRRRPNRAGRAATISSGSSS